MALIDFLLNLAGLLLWLNWLSVRLDPLARPSAATLAGTLRKAGRPVARRWLFAAALAALLLLRALLYYHVGSAADWSPKLHLGAITLSFRSDYFRLVFAYSALSFAALLGGFYLWLLLLSFLDGRDAASDPFLRLVQTHLGGVARWPWLARLGLPFATVALLWLALAPMLGWLGVVPQPGSWLLRCEQSALVGLGAYLGWKYLIVGLLALHLLHSYVYLGRSPFWSFVALAARGLLRPLRRLPLRVERVDLAPVVGLALVFWAGSVAENGLRLSSNLNLPGLFELYQRVSR